MSAGVGRPSAPTLALIGEADAPSFSTSVQDMSFGPGGAGAGGASPSMNITHFRLKQRVRQESKRGHEAQLTHTMDTSACERQMERGGVKTGWCGRHVRGSEE